MTRFRIVGTLGTGGMGVVHRAYDALQDTEVALKLSGSTDAGARARLREEFRRVRQVAHPGVVAPWELFDGVDAGALVQGKEGAPPVQPPFFTMPIVPGARIDEVFAREADPVVRLASVRAILPALLDGLAELHGRGLVHGDVKPSNLFVEGDRCAWLDFGLSSLRGEAAVQVGGTPHYLAPEVLQGDPPGPEADVYGLGVLLHELLAGRSPFPSDAPLIDKAMGRSRRLAVDLPEAGPAVDAILAAMIDRRPAARPTLDAVAEAFDVRAPERAPRLPGVVVGRETHLALLKGALHTVRGGRAVVVDLHGPSGIGKSTILDAFVERHAHDALVLRGACDRRVSAPYDVLGGALDVLARRLVVEPERAATLDPAALGLAGELFPTLLQVPGARPPDGAEPVEARRVRALVALRRVLADVARGPEPLVLVLDDLQWASEDTRRLLDELIGAPEAPQALWVLSARDVDGGTERLATSLGVPLVDASVGRLSASEVAAAWQALGGDAALLPAVAASAAGDPFLLRFFREHLHNADSGLPTSLFRDTVARAMGGLEDPARRAVAHASVAQASVLRAALLEAAGLRPAERRLLAELEDRVWMASDDLDAERVCPYHARIADLVVAVLSPDQLRQHHAGLYGALRRWGHPDARLYAHAVGAGLDEAASEHAEAAADGASARFAFLDAARWLERALVGAAPSRASVLCEKRGRALASAGRFREAAVDFREAASWLSDADPASWERAIRLRTLAADHLVRYGAVEEGTQLFREVFAAIGETLPATEAAAQVQGLLHRLLSFFGWRVGQVRTDLPPEVRLRLDVLLAASIALAMQHAAVADALQLRQLRLARRHGASEYAARGFMHEISVEAALGFAPMLRRAEAMLVELRRLAGTDPRLLAGADGAESSLGWSRGQWLRCLVHAERGERGFSALRSGVHYELGALRTFRFSGLWWSGRLPEMLAEVDALREDARLLGDTLQLDTYRLGECSSLDLVRDRPRRVVEDAAAALAGWAPEQASTQRYLRLHGLLRAWLYLGDPDAAWREVEREWEVLRRGLYLTLAPTRCVLTLGRGGVALALAAQAAPGSQRTRWLREAERCARTVRAARTWAPHLAVADLMASGAARLAGRDAPALDLLRRAVEGLEAVDMPMHAAAARAVDPDADRSASGAAALRALGVVQPGLFARMLAPGWTDPGAATR